MTWFLGILAFIFAICAVGYLLLFIIADAVLAFKYLNGKLIKVKIIEILGEEEVAGYGRSTQSIDYFKYKVEYTVNGEIKTGEVYEKKKRKSSPKSIGQKVKASCIIWDDGKCELVSRVNYDRFIRLIAVIIVTLILILIIVLVKAINK